MSKAKQFKLSKEELDHIEKLQYSVKYLQNGIDLLISELIKANLDLDPEETKLSYNIKDGRIIVNEVE